jgi:Tol biopolymer transport system component
LIDWTAVRWQNRVHFLKSRRVREIFSPSENEIRSVDGSPDGKLVYYSVYTSESDIWLLDLE